MQEPINRSLYLLYYALESSLSRVDLFIERLSGEVSHAHSSKTQSKQSLIECVVLRHIPASSSPFSTLSVVLKIKLLEKGLTQEISGDRGSC